MNTKLKMETVEKSAKLRERLKDLDASVKDIADYAGMTIPTLRAFLSGSTKKVSCENYRKLLCVCAKLEEIPKHKIVSTDYNPFEIGNL